MRGLEWDPYLPKDWFQNKNVEDENQYKEDSWMNEHYRPERILWLGCQLAQGKKWFEYNNIDHRFFPLEEDSDAQSTTDRATVMGADADEESFALETSVNYPYPERLQDWVFVGSLEIKEGDPPTPSHAGSAADIIGDALITQESISTADTATVMGADADEESFALETSVNYPYPERLQDWASVDCQEIREGNLPTPSHASDIIGGALITQESTSTADIESMRRDRWITQQTKDTADVENLIAPPMMVSVLPSEQQMDGYAIADGLQCMVNVYIDQQSNGRSNYILNLSPFILRGLLFFEHGYPADSEVFFGEACKLCKHERVNKNDQGLEPALVAVERIYQTVELPRDWSTLKGHLSCLLSFFQKPRDDTVKVKPYRDCPGAGAFPLQCALCDKKTPPYLNIFVHIRICHPNTFPKDFLEFWNSTGEILKASKSESDRAKDVLEKELDRKVEKIWEKSERDVAELKASKSASDKAKDDLEKEFNREAEAKDNLEMEFDREAEAKDDLEKELDRKVEKILEKSRQDVAKLKQELKDRFEVDFWDHRDRAWKELNGMADCEILQWVD